MLAASFFYMASPMLVTPLITGFTESISSSAALMGIVGGMMNLCSLICRPLAGNLADKMSKYRVSLIGAILMSAACAGYIMAPNAVVVVVSRIVNGVGFACCSVCMATWMSNMLPKDKIGSGMGFYGTMNALAMAVAPAIGVSAYQMFGYRVSFFIALTFSVAIIIVIQFIRDKGKPENVSKSMDDEGVSGVLYNRPAVSAKNRRKKRPIQIGECRKKSPGRRPGAGCRVQRAAGPHVCGYASTCPSL